MTDKFILIISILVLFLLTFYYMYIDPMYIINLKIFLNNTPVYFIPTLLISLLALFFTSKNYLRKSGFNISADYLTNYNSTVSYGYISNILLVNNKDRPVIIFKIYLKLRNNIFVELINIQNTPIILKPYETLSHELEPHLFYMSGLSIIKDIMEVLKNDKIKKTLILETPNGLIKCKKLYFNSIISDILKYDDLGLIVRHPGTIVDDIPIGSNTLYLITITLKDGSKSFLIIPTTPTKYLFEDKIELDSDLLFNDNSVNYIEDKINEAIKEGVINWSNYKVHSFLNSYNNYNKFNTFEKIDLNNEEYYSGLFYYYVVSKILYLKESIGRLFKK